MKQNNNIAVVLVCVAALSAVVLPPYIFNFSFGVDLNLPFTKIWEIWYKSFDPAMCAKAETSSIYSFLCSVEKISNLRLLAFQILMLLSALFPLPFYSIYYTITRKQIQEKRTKAEFIRPRDAIEYLGKDGFILSNNVQMKQQFCFEHVLVIGPTGSGKSQSFFFPNLYYLPEDSSIVVTDPKLELYRKSKQYNDTIGRKALLVKLDDCNMSIFWNPIELYEASNDIQRLCELIIKNRPGSQGGPSGGDQDFWDQAAINVLYTLIYVTKSLPNPETRKDFIKDLGAPQSYPNYYSNFSNIYQMSAQMSFEAIIGLAMFAASLGDFSIYTRAKTFSEEVAPEDTRNSMRSVVMPSISNFLMKDLRYITAYNELDFRILKREPCALYVSVPEHKVEGLEGISAVLYRQIFDLLLDEGSKDTGRTVFFLLDEFANIGKLIGIAKALATIRSRKLAVAMCLQSIEQLSRNYTDAEKKDMLNNLKTKLILPGLTENESLDYFSKIAGKTTIYEKSQISGEKQVIEKDRMPPSAIRELYSGIAPHFLNHIPRIDKLLRKLPPQLQKLFEKHECIIFFSNKPPIKDTQRRAYLDRKIRDIWENADSVELPKNSEEKFKEAEKRFFNVADLAFLEVLGMFLFCKGDFSALPEERKQSAVNSFKTIHALYRRIRYEVSNGELRLHFDEEHIRKLPLNKRHYAEFGKVILSRGFYWAYKNNLVDWTGSGELPKIQFPNSN